METITYTAPAISCEHCRHAIEDAVGAMPGVQSVEVEIPARTVQVRYDPAAIDPARIEATLEEEGYPVAH
jgi:copper chaperone